MAPDRAGHVGVTPPVRPAPGGLLGRFWWGLSRPFVLVFRLSQEPVAFRAWSLTVFVQAALTLVLGSVLFFRDLQKLDTQVMKHARKEKARHELKKAIDRTADAGVDLSELERLLPGRGKRGGHPPDEAQLKEARAALHFAEDAGWPVKLLNLERVLSELEDAGRVAGLEAEEEAARSQGTEDDEDPPAPPHPPKGQLSIDVTSDGGAGVRGTLSFSGDDDGPGGSEARTRARAEARQATRAAMLAKAKARLEARAALRKAPPPPAEDDEDEDEEEDTTPPVDLWKKLALWASSLVIVQTVLLALTRDFHDRMARDLSLVAGLQPEDLPKKPGLRIDLKWLWRKLRRRIRGFLTTASGIAALSPVLLIFGLIGGFDRATSVVVGVVSAYWWVVFTGARSARAWRLEADPTPPTPLRGLIWVHEHVPGFRWFGPRWLMRFTIWGSKSMFAPARSVERDPAAFAGLALARLVGSIPVVRIALRAALVVAAGELLETTADVEPFEVAAVELVPEPAQPVA